MVLYTFLNLIAIFSMHYQRLATLKKNDENATVETLSRYLVNFIKQSGNGIVCGACPTKMWENVVRVKHGVTSYHPRCLADIYVLPIPASE
jgi:hypothetical protein